MDGQKQRAESRALLQEVNLSHNWVVSGTRSTTGKPILQSDPHYGVTNPAFWYEIHLSGGRYNVRGLGVAGVPGMLIGWNERCAWGVTALAGDTADLFEEKVNPDNPDQYLWKDAWSSFERRSETIRIKGGRRGSFRCADSRHGPIVNDLLSGLKPGEVYALHYTLLWTPNSRSNRCWMSCGPPTGLRSQGAGRLCRAAAAHDLRRCPGKHRLPDCDPGSGSDGRHTVPPQRMGWRG